MFEQSRILKILYTNYHKVWVFKLFHRFKKWEEGGLGVRVKYGDLLWGAAGTGTPRMKIEEALFENNGVLFFCEMWELYGHFLMNKRAYSDCGTMFCIDV